MNSELIHVQFVGNKLSFHFVFLDLRKIILYTLTTKVFLERGYSLILKRQRTESGLSLLN
jgi:hypothetical protein